MTKETKEKEKQEKVVQSDDNTAKLLTQEEYDKINREKIRTKINQVSRVFGIVTIILLIYVAILDPMFEGSFFGAIFTKNEYEAFWKIMAGKDGVTIGINGELFTGKFWDDPLQFMMTWVPALGFTLAIIAAVTFAVYLITFSIADFIGLVKQTYRSFHDISKDIKGGLNDGIEKEIKIDKKKNKKKHRLFEKKEKIDELPEDAEVEKKSPGRKRRKEKDLGLEDQPEYTPEQLDILLAGGTIPETGTESTAENVNESGEKPLF